MRAPNICHARRTRKVGFVLSVCFVLLLPNAIFSQAFANKCCYSNSVLRFFHVFFIVSIHPMNDSHPSYHFSMISFPYRISSDVSNKRARMQPRAREDKYHIHFLIAESSYHHRVINVSMILSCINAISCSRSTVIVMECSAGWKWLSFQGNQLSPIPQPLKNSLYRDHHCNHHQDHHCHHHHRESSQHNLHHDHHHHHQHHHRSHHITIIIVIILVIVNQ